MSTVNYIQHQQRFIATSAHDKRLRANDISLYFMLFYCWNKHHFQPMFRINRRELMQLSHIGSREAYIGSLRRLQDCGYIQYRKSFRQFEESSIMMIPLAAEPENGPFTESDFGPHTESAFLPHTESGFGPAERQGSGPHTGQQNRPHTGPKSGLLYNKTNINNYKRERANSDSRSHKKVQNEISKEKKVPSQEEILEYFDASGLPLQEARKFFAHYEAVGWRLGNALIRNWQAAARKWAENIDSFTPKKNDNATPSAGRLHVNENKRYDIPL